MSGSRELMLNAFKTGTVIPAFNIPYIPVMEPMVRALRDTRCVGFVAVARLEFTRFGAGSLRAIHDEYRCVMDERYTRLHLDHVPVEAELGSVLGHEKGPLPPYREHPRGDFRCGEGQEEDSRPVEHRAA